MTRRAPVRLRLPQRRGRPPRRGRRRGWRRARRRRRRPGCRRGRRPRSGRWCPRRAAAPSTTSRNHAADGDGGKNDGAGRHVDLAGHVVGVLLRVGLEHRDAAQHVARRRVGDAGAHLQVADERVGDGEGHERHAALGVAGLLGALLGRRRSPVPFTMTAVPVGSLSAIGAGTPVARNGTPSTTTAKPFTCPTSSAAVSSTWSTHCWSGDGGTKLGAVGVADVGGAAARCRRRRRAPARAA